MLRVYRVPDDLPADVLADLEEDGVRPGDAIVDDGGERPAMLREVGPNVTQHLGRLHLVVEELDEQPAPLHRLFLRRSGEEVKPPRHGKRQP